MVLVFLFAALPHLEFLPEEARVLPEMALDPVGFLFWEGDLFVLDRTEGRITVFDEKRLESKQTFGRRGQGPGEWSMPSNARIGPHGIEVFDGETARLFRFGFDGRFQNQIKLTRGYGATFFSGGIIIRKLLHAHLFHMYDHSGALKLRFGQGMASQGTLSEHHIFRSLDLDCVAAIDEERGVYVVAYLNGSKLQYYDVNTGKLLVDKALDLSHFTVKGERKTGVSSQGNVFYVDKGKPIKDVVFIDPYFLVLIHNEHVDDQAYVAFIDAQGRIVEMRPLSFFADRMFFDGTLLAFFSKDDSTFRVFQP